LNGVFTLGPQIDALLERLYSRNAAQDAALATYFTERASDESMNWTEFDARTNDFLSDKLVALDRPKAEFCYQVCRALQARRVVEAGTSFGVSTIHLAAAVRDNVQREAPSERAGRPRPMVIGTESEDGKVAAARRNFAEAGLSEFIEIRHGDLRETLRVLDGPIDFIRMGAVVVCDNTLQFRDAYADYFEFIHDRRNGFRTMTLPFEGGLEFTVRVG